MKIDLTRPEKLYRYSERKWLERSLSLGEFRLRPASDYLNDECSSARRDDERHRKLVWPKSSVRIMHVRTRQSNVPVGDVIAESDVGSDYLTLCFAKVYSDHFYDEFCNSDACLIIHDPNEFSARMHRASNAVIPSGWGAIDGPVTYGANSQLGPAFIKPDKYVFQFEWRFVWLPIPPVDKCTATNIVIGSIEDIAEIRDAPAACSTAGELKLEVQHPKH